MIIKKSKEFEKSFDKLDNSLKIKAVKLVEKIISNPNIGKPMRYDRKNSRELYLKSFRVSYCLYEKECVLLFLEIYHKKKQ